MRKGRSDGGRPPRIRMREPRTLPRYGQTTTWVHESPDPKLYPSIRILYRRFFPLWLLEIHAQFWVCAEASLQTVSMLEREDASAEDFANTPATLPTSKAVWAGLKPRPASPFRQPGNFLQRAPNSQII